MEYFNEVMIMFVLYNFICFTDWQPDLEIQFQQGYVACGIVIIHIGINLFLMFRTNIKEQCLRFTRWRMMRKYAKVRGDAIYKLNR
jgi:hypothetical protein